MSRTRLNLLEGALVISIATLIVATTVNRLDEGRERAEEVDCAVYRRLVEDAEVAFVVRHQLSSTDVRELVDDALLTSTHACRAGGHYAWVPFPPGDPRFQRIYGCSLHRWPLPSAWDGGAAEGDLPHPPPAPRPARVK